MTRFMHVKFLTVVKGDRTATLELLQAPLTMKITNIAGSIFNALYKSTRYEGQVNACDIP